MSRNLSVRPAVFTWLTWRDFAAAKSLMTADADRADLMFPHRWPALWHAMADEAVACWCRARPGTRPESWWQWTAPELRRISGPHRIIQGAGRCHATGLPSVAFDSIDATTRCETQAAYLERLSLWLPGERGRVASDAFAPEPFSVDLTVSPRGLPMNERGDDDDD